ncbi:MAG: hypothetical protein ACLGI8_07365 [Acidimicrobiia bacterium]
MTHERYTLLALARVGSPWFREVARWSTAASLPIDLVKTVSAGEVQARLRSGRAFSALVVDDTVVGLDRDLLEESGRAGCAVVVVESGRAGRPWEELGASAVLAPDFDAPALMQVLSQVARPVGAETTTALSVAEAISPSGRPEGNRGRLIVVTGAGGTGSSTVAMAISQHAARGGVDVVLADLALHAEQAMLHATPDVVPGLAELADAHRLGRPGPESIRSLTWHIATRGYDLLLGLRRHQDWTALRRRSLALTLEGLRHSYPLVVADVDPDLEGERATGSMDVEERNALSRAAVEAADLVVVVGTGEMKGIHSLLRVVRGVVDHGTDPARVLPVVNRAPRSARARAELTRAIGTLALRDPRPDPSTTGPALQRLPSPVFLGERRHLDTCMRDTARLPETWLRPVGAAALALLDHSAPGASTTDPDPVPVMPGSLGVAAIDSEGSA